MQSSFCINLNQKNKRKKTKTQKKQTKIHHPCVRDIFATITCFIPFMYDNKALIDDLPQWFHLSLQLFNYSANHAISIVISSCWLFCGTGEWPEVFIWLFPQYILLNIDYNYQYCVTKLLLFKDVIILPVIIIYHLMYMRHFGDLTLLECLG